MSLSHSPILSTLASANVAMAALTSLVAWLIEPFGRAIDQDCLLSPIDDALSRAATSAQVCVDRGQASAHDAAIGEPDQPLHRMLDAAVGPRPSTVDMRLHFSFLRALALIAAASLALMLPACWERVAPLIAARACDLSGIGNERPGPAKTLAGSALRTTAFRVAITPAPQSG